MTQSSLMNADGPARSDSPAGDGPLPPGGLHVAIVMDGNGRWAKARGLPRSAGHRAGASAVRKAVEAATPRNIDILTLYAFSSDNWHRPAWEVRHLMRLFLRHLRSEAERCEREGVRVRVIGRRDRLGADLNAAIESIEERTREGSRLHLRLAIDYSSRDAILEAARLHRIEGTPPGVERPSPASAPSPPLTREAFSRLISRALHAEGPTPDVDLLIRTGGEKRLSDFMLWECAYAELVFAPCLWPDFGETDLERALEDFRSRERRFGGVGPASQNRPSPTPGSRWPRDRKARVSG